MSSALGRPCPDPIAQQEINGKARLVAGLDRIWPHMPPGFAVAARLLSISLLLIVGWILLSPMVIDLERTAASALAGILGIEMNLESEKLLTFFAPGGIRASLAVSAATSFLVPALTLIGVALFVVDAVPLWRVLAALAAITVCVVGNVFQLVITILAISTFSPAWSQIYNGWFGSLITLLITMVGYVALIAVVMTGPRPEFKRLRPVRGSHVPS